MRACFARPSAGCARFSRVHMTATEQQRLRRGLPCHILCSNLQLGKGVPYLPRSFSTTHYNAPHYTLASRFLRV
eukprot:scaffold36312_cov35-Tisochrysis_lutea.AAC.2